MASGIEVVAAGPATGETRFADVPDEVVAALYADIVLARAVNEQADTLARQGALAVYASSAGQEACQAGCVAPLRRGDMLFPTYRDTVAAVLRGVPVPDVLALFSGSWHCGFVPHDVMCMPLTTPIATHALHAVGWAMGRRLDGAGDVALALVGDGGTSEGDFAEALNFAGVAGAPVVFFVQNNGWAISVPVEQQSAAPTLAHKAVAAGICGLRCDGQDMLSVYAATAWALDHARAGSGPVLIEALTYRFGPHTNSDDPGRYRDEAEAEPWLRRDPLDLAGQAAKDRGVLTDEVVAAAEERAKVVRAAMRRALFDEATEPDPMEMFDHVFVDGTGHHERQRARLRAELDGDRGAP